MQEPNGHAVVLPEAENLHELFNFIPVQGNEYGPVCSDPFRQREASLTLQKWLGEGQVQIVLFKTAFGPHLDDIPKSCGGHQRGSGALPFNKGIGGKRRSMDDLRYFPRVYSSKPADLADAVDDCALRCCVSRQNLDRLELTGTLQHDICKGASDINADPEPFRHFAPHRLDLFA